jgi:hypothetical protein
LKKNLNKKESSEIEDKVPVLELPKELGPYVHSKKTALDKLRAHYLEGKRLSPKLEQLRLIYEHTNALLREGYSRQQTVNFLTSQIEISQGHAYEIVRVTMALFGDIHKSTQEGLRQIVIDNLWQVYRRAVLAGDRKQQNVALKEIGKIGGLHKNGEDIDWSAVRLPTIVFSDDPTILKLNEQAEDVDHEDLE